jgi:hypothetical protein
MAKTSGFFVPSTCDPSPEYSILAPMKKFAVLWFIIGLSTSVFAKNPEPKTFLVLFKSKELKEYKTGLKDIEAQFADVFSTEMFEGNSDPAILIKIPTGDFDACFLGEFLVDLNNGEKVQLQHIAFRLFDLSQNQTLHQQYLAMYEENMALKKKTAKPSKAASNP